MAFTGKLLPIRAGERQASQKNQHLSRWLKPRQCCDSQRAVSCAPTVIKLKRRKDKFQGQSNHRRPIHGSSGAKDCFQTPHSAIIALMQLKAWCSSFKRKPTCQLVGTPGPGCWGAGIVFAQLKQPTGEQRMWPTCRVVGGRGPGCPGGWCLPKPPLPSGSQTRPSPPAAGSACSPARRCPPRTPPARGPAQWRRSHLRSQSTCQCGGLWCETLVKQLAPPLPAQIPRDYATSAADSASALF